MDLRDSLLRMIDDAIEDIYDSTGKDYNEMTDDLKDIIKHLHAAEAAIRRAL